MNIFFILIETIGLLASVIQIAVFLKDLNK